MLGKIMVYSSLYLEVKSMHICQEVDLSELVLYQIAKLVLCFPRFPSLYGFLLAVIRCIQVLWERQRETSAVSLYTLKTFVRCHNDPGTDIDAITHLLGTRQHLDFQRLDLQLLPNLLLQLL